MCRTGVRARSLGRGRGGGRERRAHACLAGQGLSTSDESAQNVPSGGRIDPEHHAELTVCGGIGFAKLTTVGPDGGGGVIHCDDEGGRLRMKGGVADGGAVTHNEVLALVVQKQGCRPGMGRRSWSPSGWADCSS